MSDYVPKLVHLPGTELSPEFVLHRTLNKLNHIQAVAVVILWKNGESDTDWSQMNLSELCWVSRSLDECVSAIVRREMPAIKEQI